MADNDDSWIFDSLVNFLHGNIWKMPVLGFVEDKSVVFDPDSYAALNDEKEEEFRKIHEEYKALVDYMLSSFMDDLQVSPEQVEEACKNREKQVNAPESHVTKVALEQLQAAEDFHIFRRIMTRKNIDLQLQSLELLVSKYGVLSPSLRSNDGSEPSPGDNGEDDFLQVVIRYCDDLDLLGEGHKSTTKNVSSSTLHKDLGIEKATKSGAVQEQAQSLNEIITVSAQPQPQSKSQLIQQDLEDRDGQTVGKATIGDQTPLPLPTAQPPEIKPHRKQQKDGKKKSVKFDETTVVAEVAQLAPEQHRMLTSVRKALEMDPEDEPSDANPTTLDQMEMDGSEEDIQRRRAYLRGQRDKLVALKKREREKQLQAGNSNDRPKSARAAQMALRSPPSATGERSLAARRALAAVLKQELLHK